MDKSKPDISFEIDGLEGEVSTERAADAATEQAIPKSSAYLGTYGPTLALMNLKKPGPGSILS